MSLVILHLSDFHFSTKGSNPLDSKRQEALHGAIRSNLSRNDSCLLVYSGDLANHGKLDEYKLFQGFLEGLDKVITEQTGNRPTHVLAPGNHDLDFGLPGYSEKLRDMILSNTSPLQPPDEKMLQECLAPQAPYRLFVEETGKHLTIVAPHHLTQSSIIEIGPYKVRVHLFNTAFQSTIHEKYGSLWFPIDILERNFQENPAEDISISVFHHPYGWLNPDNARRFRDIIEANSDIIFTGHEHVAGSFQKTKRTTQQNIYIEGGVLQDLEHSSESSFNVVQPMEGDKSFYITTFSWSGEAYEPQNEPHEYKFIRTRKDALQHFNIREDWKIWLEQVGTEFRNPRCPQLTLSDIFVYPDLQKLDIRRASNPTGLVNDGEIVGYLQEKKRVCIGGNEKAGKTSLAKRLFQDFSSGGLVPCLVKADFDFSKNRKEPLEKRFRDGVNKVLNQIYEDDGSRCFWEARIQDRVIIVDDFDRFDLNLELRNAFLKWCDENFGIIVLFASPGIRFSDILDHSDSSICLLAYDHADICESDSETQWHLVKRWQQAGSYQADPDEQLKTITKHFQIISGMIGQGVVPSIPLSVLMMAQQLESGGTIEGTGVYGALYEGLIRDALKPALKGPGDLEVKFNYLTYFAFNLFISNKKFVTESEYRSWHQKYCEEFTLVINPDEILIQFKSIGIFKKGEDDIGFKYKYYYCFFLARYLAHHLHEAKISILIEEFCNRLYVNDIANTMLFLCHLTKEPKILNLILERVRANFKGVSEYEIQRMPELVPDGFVTATLALGVDSVEEERIKQLKEADKFVRPHGLVEVQKEEEEALHHELIALINEANAAHHSIRLCGQILRNFYGSLSGEKKLEIIQECYGVGLRMISVLIETLEKEKQEFAEALSEVIKHRNPDLTGADLEAQVKRSLYGYAMLIIYGIIKHTSNCLGFAELKPSLDKMIAEKKPTVSHKMFDISTRLDFFSGFPEEFVMNLADDLKKGTLGYEALRILVFEYLKLHKTEYRTRQRVCSKLEIKTSDPKIIDASTKQVDGGKPGVHVLMPPQGE